MESDEVRLGRARRREEIRGLLLVAAGTALIMLVYLTARVYLLPGLTAWQARWITVVVVTVLATVAAWRTGRRMARLNSSLDLVVEKLDAELTASHESEARKDAVLRSALDCIVSINHQGEITEFNPAAERVFGLRRSEVLGKNVADTIIPDSLRGAHRTGFAHHLSTGETRILGTRIETTGRRADGSEFPVEVAVTRVDLPGSPAFTAYIRDITDRRRMEEQLQHSQKLEATGRLAGGIAHDFNNLLMVIMGHSAELLADGEADPELRSAAADIQAAAERGAMLTRQLLAFSRQQVLHPADLDLSSVVTGLERMLRRLVSEAIRIVVVAPPGLGMVRADQGQIEQVILNLVINARDAMPDGGTLTLRTDTVVIDEAYVREHVLVQPGSYVMLSVSDTGTGMDESTRAQIFEPFFTTKGLGRGTGLGLSIVHGIVSQSGGHVWVYSEVGKGTAFKVYLPRVGSGPGAVTPRTDPVLGGSLRGTETILLVEDDAQLRQLCESTVASNGYRVLAAASAEEAETIYNRHAGEIDLLLTDVVMPGMNGWQLWQRLRARDAQLRTLFMSGYTDHAIGEGEDSGWAFLQKPFSPSVLRAKIRQVLDAPPGVDGRR